MYTIEIISPKGHRETVPLCNLPHFVAEAIAARKVEMVAEEEQKQRQAEIDAQIAAAQQQRQQQLAEAIANPIDLSVPAVF